MGKLSNTEEQQFAGVNVGSFFGEEGRRTVCQAPVRPPRVCLCVQCVCVCMRECECARAEAFLRLRCLETEGAIGKAEGWGWCLPDPPRRGAPRTPAPDAGEGRAGKAPRAVSRPRGAHRGGAGEEAGAAWSF